MRKWILGLVTAALMGVYVDETRAAGGCNGPFCGYGYGAHVGGHPGVGFLAAPWYLYWPYDAHFMTPAPVYGAYYPPPTVNGWYSPPYFPMHATPYTPAAPAPANPTGYTAPVNSVAPVDPSSLPYGG